MAQGGAGKQFFLLLVLLAIVGGAGAWNYQRNLAAEEAIPRPWKGYSEADLEAMAGAYRKEVDQYSKRWQDTRGQRQQASGRGHIDDRSREFDQIYAKGREERKLKSTVAEHEVILAQIEQELGLRAGERDEWSLHLRRLTTF